MKFVRHLAAVALLVVLVVAGGLAWGHFADGLPPGLGPRGVAVFVRGQVVKQLPAGARPGQGHPPPGVRIGDSGGENLGLNSMFQAVNLPVLRDTVEIEAGAIAAVVLLGTGHRRWRRSRRAG